MEGLIRKDIYDEFSVEEDIVDTTFTPPKIETQPKMKTKSLTTVKKTFISKTKTSSTSSLPKTIKCELCENEIDKWMYKTHVESHPSKILDWLYLGSYNMALNKKELQRVKIKYILNCAYECKNLFEGEFKYKHIKLSDSPEVKLFNHLEDALGFIEEAKDNGENIFIHCQMGKSRSASIVIAYLIKYSNMSTEEAYKFVKEQRKAVFPNIGFMRQLREYEKILKGENVNLQNIDESEDFLVTKK